MSEVSKSEIKQYLKEWVNTKTSPHFAVLIKGKWGSGKTHFVKSLVVKPLDAEKDITGKRAIYISLFGIQSVETLQRQFFMASAGTATKFTNQLLGFGAKIAKEHLFNTGVFNNTVEKLQKADTNLNKAFLILDDLERCTIPMPELLGVINALVEHGDTRVLLVANDEKMGEEQKAAFTSFSEKIIGHSFELASDPEAAISAFIGEISDDSGKEIVKKHRDQIIKLYHMSGYHNLRALRQYIYQLAGIVAKLEDKFQNHTELMEALVFQLFVFFIEFKLDLGGAKIELCPDNIAALTNQHATLDFSDLFDSDNTSPTKKLLKKYSIANGFRTVTQPELWFSMLHSGVVDKETLNTEIADADVFKGWDYWPSWKRLWNFPRTDFSSEKVRDQFNHDLNDLTQKLKDGTYQNTREFLHVAGLVLEFSSHGIHDTKIDDAVKELKTYVDEKIIPQMTIETYKAHIDPRANVGPLASYDGLAYMGQNTDEFKGISSYLWSQLDKWHENWMKNDVGTDLLEVLKADYMKFLGDVVLNNAGGQQRFLDTPVLHELCMNLGDG